MKWLEITIIILQDAFERLHRLHIWFLFPLFGGVLGAMLGVFIFSRSQSMVLGAFFGLLLGFRIAKWYLNSYR